MIANLLSFFRIGRERRVVLKLISFGRAVVYWLCFLFYCVRLPGSVDVFL